MQVDQLNIRVQNTYYDVTNHVELVVFVQNSRKCKSAGGACCQGHYRVDYGPLSVSPSCWSRVKTRPKQPQKQ